MTTKALTLKNLMAAMAAAVLVIGALALAAMPDKAYAYGVDQTGATDSSVTVGWADPNAGSSYSETTGYTVNWGLDYSSATNAVNLNAAQRSYTITGLAPGSKYYVSVKYTQRSKSTGSTSTYTLGSEYPTTRCVKPTGVNQTKWYYFIQNVEFGWNRQEAAKAVEYKIAEAKSGKVVESNTSSYPSSTFSSSKVKNTFVYTVEMRVQDDYGWSPWSDKAFLFTQPMVAEKKTKVANGKLSVSWKKITGADSYEVYVSKKEKSGYKKVAKVKSSKSSVTVKKLSGKKFSPKKKYYVYVVANKKAGGQTYTSGRLYSYQVKGKTGSLRWSF